MTLRKCRGGKVFVAHGMGVSHGRSRSCTSDQHKVQPREHRVALLAQDEGAPSTTLLLYPARNDNPACCP
jgi:hypothetical protein